MHESDGPEPEGYSPVSRQNKHQRWRCEDPRAHHLVEDQTKHIESFQRRGLEPQIRRPLIVRGGNLVSVVEEASSGVLLLMTVK